MPDTRASGIYALIDLAGGPVPAQDARALGLNAGPMPAVEGFDHMLPWHVALDDDGERLCVVVGAPSADPQLRRRLRLEPRETTPRMLLAAIHLLGADAASAMAGEWSCLVWHRPSGEVQLLQSLAVRDALFYRRHGSLLAVAPSTRALHRLGWDDGALNDRGLLLHLSRRRLRRGIGDTSFLRGVRAVGSGTLVSITQDAGAQVERAAPLRAEPWDGGFDEAIGVVTDILGDRIERAMEGHAGAAVLTSGGLDSSTLAWLAHERSRGTRLTLVSSVAPAGSGLSDERVWSDMVARHLGLPIQWVTPDENVSPYRPSLRAMQVAHGPLLGPRHYLYDALYDAALACGATLLLDGVGGEASVTASHPQVPWRARARRWWKSRRAGALGAAETWPAAAFHARLARHRLATLPDSWRELWDTPFAESRGVADGRMGFRPYGEKLWQQPSEAVHGRLRIEYAFRDPALLRRFAGFPVDYLRHGGQERAVARAMMQGRLPDAVRLRPKGSDFSPDYAHRMQRHAAAAAARIPLFRRADLDDWFDLDWQESRLGAIGAGLATAMDAMQAQATQLAAEYLLWLSDPGRAES